MSTDKDASARRRTLKRGDTGGAVIGWQTALQVGHFMGDGETDIDDLFGNATEDGTINFQVYANGRGAADVDETGVVDEATFNAMKLYLGVNILSLADKHWPLADEETPGES